MMIPTWADRYIGAEYEDHGRGPTYDCFGLVRAVLKNEFHLSIPDYADEYAEADNTRAVDELLTLRRQAWPQVPEGQERAGDVAVFRIAQWECHLGVVVDPGQMLHILKGHNAVVERFRGLMWRQRLIDIVRHPSLMV